MTMSSAREDLSRWHQARRYSVPRWMIEEATERRLAGDWQAACAVADVDIAFDPADVTPEIEADLRHLVPDLLRWHVPRGSNSAGTMATLLHVTLARYGPGHELQATTPHLSEGPQRLTLRLGPAQRDDDHYGVENADWTSARHLWDARHTAELRERGGGNDHATALHAEGKVEEAFAAAGVELEIVPFSRERFRTRDHLDMLAHMPLDIARLKTEVALLTARGVDKQFRVMCPEWPYMILLEPSREGLKARVLGEREDHPHTELTEVHWRRLPDLDLLRAGLLTPDELHPLVREALFPDLPPGESGPWGPDLPHPVRVRCGGEWHEVVSGGGTLQIPHSEDEQRRERAMRALGGAVAGCFAAQRSWTSGQGKLPKKLRFQRRNLFMHAQHGDTQAVLRLLDDGLDPRIRDGRQRTLLHILHLVDWELLLPRLLEAGLDVDAVDYQERTPLHHAVASYGSPALVEALRAAGASIDVVDWEDWSLADMIRRRRRKDLADLRAEIERDHPGIGIGYESDGDEDEDDEE
ncbi:ankyrin repeat domain-containing protein [Herbidospora mongoliensis]|uniref:ankyrin repeat domain-containing protein n=1 Tax=Herbidospora mongoliensis TaxID=688067 RepID=UPI00082BCD30|nr:ankyrin repeat domain-containing protein [Herbidospora mongoliensis]